jgi:hypothetical protein
MAKQVVVKVKYEDEIRKIPATAAKEQLDRLIVHNGNDKVAEFRLDKVEYWALEDVGAA